MNCGICSGATEPYSVKNPDMQSVAAGYECTNCGFIHLFLPDKDYTEWDGVKFYLDNRQWFDRKYSRLVHKIFEYTGKSNFSAVCDIGCGPGFFLNKISANSQVNIGVELNPHFIDYINGQNLNITVVDPTGFQRLSNNYDVILLDNVLEHLNNFDTVLEDSWSNLNVGGLMVISVPQVDWARKLLQKFKVARRSSYSNVNMFNDIHEHVNYFTNSSIRQYFCRVRDSELLSKDFHHAMPTWQSFIFKRVLRLSTGYWFIKKHG